MFAKLKKIIFGILLLICVWVGAWSVQAQTEPYESPKNINVVLLVDFSESTQFNKALFEKAARLLSDFLNEGANTADISYQLGAAKFGADFESAVLIPLEKQRQLSSSFFNSELLEGTEFIEPIKWAQDEIQKNRDKYDNENGRSLIVLITDGEPATTLGECQLGQFEALADEVDKLNQDKIEFLVINSSSTTSDDDADTDADTNEENPCTQGAKDQWEGLLDDHYIQVDNETDIIELYWGFLGDMFDPNNSAIEMANNQDETVEIEPYLDEVTFTVLKSNPDDTLRLDSPSSLYNQDLSNFLIRGGSGSLYEVYKIPVPENGQWKLELDNSTGRLWVDKVFSTIVLDAPEVGAVGRPIEVVATVSQGLESLELSESIRMELVTSGVPRQGVASFEQDESGRLTAEVIFTGVISSYLIAEISINDQIAESIQVEPVGLEIIRLPTIHRFDVTQSDLGKPLEIAYKFLDFETVDAFKALLTITNRKTGEETPVVLEPDQGNYTFDPQSDQEADFELTLTINGEIQGISFEDSVIATQSYSPEPILQTPEITPSATPITQPETPSRVPWYAILIVASVILILLFVLYKAGGVSGSGNSKEPSRGQSEKKENCHRIIRELLNRMDQNKEDDQRLLRDTLSDLKAISGDRGFFDDNGNFLKELFVKSDSVEVLIFLQGLSRLLLDLWDDVEGNPTEMMKVIYDDILNPRYNISFKEVVDVLMENKLIKPDQRNFLEVWGELDGQEKATLATTAKSIIRYFPNTQESRMYELLRELNSKNFSYPFELKLKYKETLDALKKFGLKSEALGLLFRNIQNVFDSFPNINDDSSTVLLEGYKEKITQVLSDHFERSDKPYAKLPETKIVRIYFREVLARVEGVIASKKEAAIPSHPGEVGIEIRPTLDLSTLDEEFQGDKWKYKFTGIAYHLAGSPAIEIESFYSLEDVVKKLTSSSSHFTQLDRNGVEAFKLEYPLAAKTQNFAFHIKYKTFGTVGREKQKIDQEYKTDGLEVAFEMDDYQVVLNDGELEIKSPFVVGRPLNEAEYILFYHDIIQERIDSLVTQINQLEGAGLIVIEGLRQSGKTTILDNVVRKINNNQLAKYLTLEIDLMVWWEEKIKHTNIQEKDYRATLWRYCAEHLKTNYESYLGEQDDNSGNVIEGECDLKYIWAVCKDLRKSELRLLFVIDDADLFSRFELDAQVLAQELRNLCRDHDTVLVTANDDRSMPWLTRLLDNYNALYREKRVGVPANTMFLRLWSEEHTAYVFEIENKLKLTALAKKALYVFTGGWPVLIHKVGDTLIKRINNTLKAQRKAYRLVTVGDIKKIITELTTSDAGVLNYVQASFDPNEILLLQIMVNEHYVDIETGVLQYLSLDSKGWHGTTRLRETLKRFESDHSETPASYEELDFLNDITNLLYQLRTKQIIEIVEINFRSQLYRTSSLRLRVGTLHRYYQKEYPANVRRKRGTNG
jgi:hypothetical protein